MKYLPGLIPKHGKVLPEYFKGDLYAPAKEADTANVLLSYAAAAIVFAAALLFIRHPLVFLLFGAAGFILLPQGRRSLERKLRFDLTNRIKLASAGVLLLCTAPLIKHYGQEERQELAASEAKQREEDSVKAVAAERLKQDGDSLNLYLGKSKALKDAHKSDEALSILSRAMRFASTSEGTNRISEERNEIELLQVKTLIDKKQYKQAIPALDGLIRRNPSGEGLHYNRALCYSKTGRIADAVAELKVAMQNGNPGAEKLYEKINPVRRRVIDLLTRCCDGTLSPSNAKGRGACSHHGGVCDWNEPLYQEYRQYE